MTEGKVLTLYMTMPDMMRAGHRTRCEDFECDERGIVGSRDYDNGEEQLIMLVSKTSYDIIEEAELVLESGVLMEDIYTDIDLYHLKKGSVIEVGDALFEVYSSCEDYRYLYAFSPELPELLRGKRGLFLKPMDYAEVSVGDTVKVLKEA